MTFFIIATGKYIDYFNELYEDLVECLKFIDEIEVILLTDHNFLQRDTLDDRSIRIKKFDVSYPDWVSATLLRYQAISEHASSITSDTVFWIDADMRMVNIEKFCKEVTAVTSLTFAKHPGFLFNLKDFATQIIKNLSTLVLSKPSIFLDNQFFRGTWEEKMNSQASVPPRQRKVYVHGAFFGGPVKEFMEMCQTLANCVESDLNMNYVAIWHDESHLNRYSSDMGRKNKYFSKYFSGANELTHKPSKSIIWSIDKKS